jgi:hypothetical protein
MRVMWVSADAQNVPAVNFGSSGDMSNWMTVTGTSTSYSINVCFVFRKLLALCSHAAMQDLCAAPGNISQNFINPGTVVGCFCSLSFLDPRVPTLVVYAGTIHDVLLVGLLPSTTYYYRVGNPTGGPSVVVYTTRQRETDAVCPGWSPIHRFVSAPPAGAPVDVIAYGDLGVGMTFNVTSNYGEQQQESRRTVRAGPCAPRRC